MHDNVFDVATKPAVSDELSLNNEGASTDNDTLCNVFYNNDHIGILLLWEHLMEMREVFLFICLSHLGQEF